MDTLTALVQRRDDVSSDTAPVRTLEPARTLAATATYVLSEEGRKASLLAGGNGRAVQQLAIDVPVNRLHLVSVDEKGVARLKLRPRYQLNGDQQVIRADAAPTYDAPPTIDDLYREAARNHQLERAYNAERHAAKIKRRETYYDRRAAIAQAFLDDATRRALVHPTPTPMRCHLLTEQGRIVFDAKTDTGVPGQVPAEAPRRFRADQRAQRERNLQKRNEQKGLHEQKARFLAEWMTTYATSEVRARYSAGVLPINDAMEAMADTAFAVLAGRPRYRPDGASRLQASLRQRPQFARVVVGNGDVLVTNADAQVLTAAQWTAVNEFQTLLPDATVVVRVHRVQWKHDPSVALPPTYGVLVPQRVGPFTLRREYASPAADAQLEPTADQS